MLFIMMLLLSFSGQSNSVLFTGGDPKWRIEEFRYGVDTLHINIHGWDDLYFFYPFGEYLTMTDFKKNNTWTGLFKETKLKDPFPTIAKDTNVYCYCEFGTKICIKKRYYPFISESRKVITFVGKTNYISSPKIILKHNIRIGMSLRELLTLFGYLPDGYYRPFKVVQFDYYTGGEYHSYIFENEKLKKIIFHYTTSVYKEDDFDCGWGNY